MRPAALLTGLTGVVAVTVLVYIGLTALNLEPHITFGDPNRLVASADTGGAAKPPVSSSAFTSPAAVTPIPPAVVSAPSAPPIEKPAVPVSQPQETAPAVVTPPQAPAGKASGAADTGTPSPPAAAAPSTAPVASAPAAPEPLSIPSANRASEAAAALANALNSTAPAPPALPVKPPVQEAAKTPPISEEKPSAAPANSPETAPPASIPSIPAQTAPSVVTSDSAADAEPLAAPPTPTSRPVEEAAKPDMLKHDESSAFPPSLPAIPTPLARPEPPPVEEAKVLPALSEKPAEPAPAVKAAPPVEEASLPPNEATPPRQPDTPSSGQTAALEPNADLKPVDLSRPLAERAGVLTIGNKVVQLAGILPTDPARSCTGPNGKEWPCGTLARTALRAFLLGRTITCDVPDPQWKGPVTAECRFARVSLSDWLARNGWAEPEAGSSLMAAADEARKSGLGIYGNDPRKKHISTLAPTPPPEDPLNPI